jgi:hypothetical protein
VTVGITLGGAVFFYTSRVLRSDEARLLVERVPLPAGLRGYLGG